MAEKINLTLDEKWSIVERYYTHTYKDPITKAYVKFKRKPNEIQINYLFNMMKRLVDTELEHQTKKK